MHPNRNIAICLLCAMTLFFSCSKPWDANSYRNTNEDDTYSLYDLYIDEYGNKGVVAWKYYYKWKNGDVDDYMLVLSLDETVLPWGPMNERVYLSDSVPISWRFGVTMLQSMYERGIERYPAMNWCNQKNNGDKPYSGSWRLPAQDDWIRIMDDNKPFHFTALNQALKKYGGAPLDEDAMYWMCDEDYEGHVKFVDGAEKEMDCDPYNNAVAQNTQIQLWTDKDRWIKKIYNNVRAVKFVVFRYE